MITNPTPQRNLRGHKPARPTPRVANSPDHQAFLAARLTARDKWIIRMLHEHRVLTSHQIATLAFPSPRSGRQRLRELFQWSVIDRFQPFISVGTAPMHYVLAPAGATVLAAAEGIDVRDLGYRHDRALGIAYSLRLAHTVGVNDWFAALVDRARRDPRVTVDVWWSETRCARHFGDIIKPDAYGRLTIDQHEVEFFLEYDFGTEVLTKLAHKLVGYAALAETSGITTPLLVWLPTARREAAARSVLRQFHGQLDHSDVVPVATASNEHLNLSTPLPSPADPVWLPLGTSAERCEPHRLLDAWPNLQPSAPVPDTSQDVRLLPAPAPTPPPSNER
ncbi:replication-relaxation family protein [Kibdelosporangium lantanae]|uniref:Replication-relaxation family protein n=1 Tax=Kibdelosporangium lantanae TaxID=1497396 RepID=A0ABW3M1X0_9PSEU